MKIEFRKAKLSKKNLVKLEKVNTIIEEYADQGYKLTLRQLYYQLVSRDVIANNTREYDKLSHILTEGRMGGLVDWYAIEDRIRVPNLPYMVDGIEDAMADTVGNYMLDRQLGQENYIELWVEKDAISNILKTKTHHYGVRLMVNRGYSSTTAIHDSYNRMVRAIENGQKPHILYLGDHDPSGLNMVLGDIPNRLHKEFGVEVDINHIGLTMEQVARLNPPPNPAKMSDPRAKWYVSNYGDTSWEVDALNPPELHKIIDSSIESLLNMDDFNNMIKVEADEKKRLSNAASLVNQHDELTSSFSVIKSTFDDIENAGEPITDSDFRERIMDLMPQIDELREII